MHYNKKDNDASIWINVLSSSLKHGFHFIRLARNENIDVRYICEKDNVSIEVFITSVKYIEFIFDLVDEINEEIRDKNIQDREDKLFVVDVNCGPPMIQNNNNIDFDDFGFFQL